MDERQRPIAGEAGPAVAIEPPFGRAFFQSVLPDRVMVACDEQRDRVPVVLIRLADGTVLDLCHVPLLMPQCFAASVYRDPHTCADMDLVLAPYQLVTWVRISLRDRASRAIGFRLTEVASVDDDAEQRSLMPPLRQDGQTPTTSAG